MVFQVKKALRSRRGYYMCTANSGLCNCCFGSKNRIRIDYWVEPVSQATREQIATRNPQAKSIRWQGEVERNDGLTSDLCRKGLLKSLSPGVTNVSACVPPAGR